MLRNLFIFITYQLASDRDRLHRESRERLHREATDLKSSLSSHDIARQDAGERSSPLQAQAPGAASVAPGVRLRVRQPPEMGWEEAA